MTGFLSPSLNHEIARHKQFIFSFCWADDELPELTAFRWCTSYVPSKERLLDAAFQVMFKKKATSISKENFTLFTMYTTGYTMPITNVARSCSRSFHVTTLTENRLLKTPIRVFGAKRGAHWLVATQRLRFSDGWVAYATSARVLLFGPARQCDWLARSAVRFITQLRTRTTVFLDDS